MAAQDEKPHRQLTPTSMHAAVDALLTGGDDDTQVFVDLGCGEGNVLEYALGCGCSIVIGLDNNLATLRTARKRLRLPHEPSPHAVTPYSVRPKQNLYLVHHDLETPFDALTRLPNVDWRTLRVYIYGDTWPLVVRKGVRDTLLMLAMSRRVHDARVVVISSMKEVGGLNDGVMSDDLAERGNFMGVPWNDTGLIMDYLCTDANPPECMHARFYASMRFEWTDPGLAKRRRIIHTAEEAQDKDQQKAFVLLRELLHSSHNERQEARRRAPRPPTPPTDDGIDGESLGTSSDDDSEELFIGTRLRLPRFFFLQQKGKKKKKDIDLLFYKTFYMISKAFLHYKYLVHNFRTLLSAVSSSPVLLKCV